MPIIKTDKELRPRDVEDHYPTPDDFVASAIALVPPELVVERIFDPGAGNGVFGAQCIRRWPNAKIAGFETRVIPKPAAYSTWLNLSFVGMHIPVAVDLVIGNPPYRFAEEAVRFGWAHLRPGGYMVYLLRLAFLEGQDRYRKLWREMPPNHVAVCANRPSFTGIWTEDGKFVNDGKTDATAYAFMVWEKPFAPGEGTNGYAYALTSRPPITMTFVYSGIDPKAHQNYTGEDEIDTDDDYEDE